MTSSSVASLATQRSKASPAVEHLLFEAIAKVRYGTVVVVIQDGVVVQIETTEKHRINPHSQ
ncbi:MAG: DUF2292 domain-containing protein [Pseudomonadota bacterium]